MNSLHADHKGFQDILLKQQFFNITNNNNNNNNKPRNDGQRSVLINTFLGFFIIPCIRYFPYQQKNKFLTKRGLGYIYHCHAALRRKFIASILWNIAIRILCNFNTSLHFICLFCFVLFCFVFFLQIKIMFLLLQMRLFRCKISSRATLFLFVPWFVVCSFIALLTGG